MVCLRIEYAGCIALPESGKVIGCSKYFKVLALVFNLWVCSRIYGCLVYSTYGIVDFTAKECSLSGYLGDPVMLCLFPGYI